MSIIYSEKKKPSAIVTALRVVFALTCCLKGVYTVQTSLKSLSILSFDISLAGNVVLGSILSGMISFGLFWLITSMIYNNLSISRYFPNNESGDMAVSRNQYMTMVYSVGIGNNIVIGAFNAMLYALPVAYSFVTMLLVRLIAIASALVFEVLLWFKCGRGKTREFVFSTALPTFFLFVVMGV